MEQINETKHSPSRKAMDRQLQNARPSVLDSPSLFKPLTTSPSASTTVTDDESDQTDSGVEHRPGIRRTKANGVTTFEITPPRTMVPELIATSPLSPRPFPARAHTAPGSPASPVSPMPNVANLSVQPRARSPYSRPHLRTRSSTASPLLQPSATRSYGELGGHIPRPSSPLARPASPFGLTGRRVSPLRRPLEESHSFSSVDIDMTIAENKELDLKPRPTLQLDTYPDSITSAPHTPTSPPSSGGSSQHSTFPRMRRRPSSPLHVSSASPNYRLHTSTSSPALRSPASPALVDPAKFNESYPQSVGAHIGTSAFSIGSGSSMPSTPSSFRSRSPSISSLETIPDSPDAEEEAIAAAETDKEKDALARLRAAAADRNEGGRTRGRTLGRTGDYFSGAGSDKRKRWSVCGAERRGDWEMETIWED